MSPSDAIYRLLSRAHASSTRPIVCMNARASSVVIRNAALPVTDTAIVVAFITLADACSVRTGAQYSQPLFPPSQVHGSSLQ